MISLVFLLLIGCNPSQSTIAPHEKTITVNSPTVSDSQSTQNTTQTDTERSSTVQPTAIPSVTTVPMISTLDAYNLININKENPNFIIVDVRTVAEFKNEHIANGINIDYYSPDINSIVGKLDKNRQYLIYCRTGIRGAGVTLIMVDSGFKEVYNLSGGIVQWIQDGYPTVN